MEMALMQKGSTWKIVKVEIEPPLLITNYGIYIGCDPGTSNLGIAIIDAVFDNPKIELYEIDIERSKDAVERIQTVRFILTDILFGLHGQQNVKMIIEGASYGNNFRQVELAEQRATMVLWALDHSIIPSLISPLSIRKKVFGSAKIKAEDTWKELPPNAASALACAYYVL